MHDVAFYAASQNDNLLGPSELFETKNKALDRCSHCVLIIHLRKQCTEK